MKLGKLLQETGKQISKRSPEILIGVGIAGMVGSTVYAVKATPKAMILLDQKKSELQTRELKPTTIVKTTWKCYAPSIILSGLSTVCIIAGCGEFHKRNVALATAVSISQSALNDYKDKIVEVVGSDKAKEVSKAVAAKKVKEHPSSDEEVIFTGNGDDLCYDMISGRYFKGSINTVERAVNEMNRIINQDGSVSLNDLYYEIGLPPIRMGEVLGWSNDYGLIDPTFTSELTRDNKPCIVVDCSYNMMSQC